MSRLSDMRPTTVVPRLLALATVIFAFAATAPAHAGTYEVYACDPSHGGSAAPTFAAVADPGMAAYDDCPSGGIVARSSWDGGTSSQWQGAYRFLDAPPGAVVQSISGYIKLERNSCSWATSLVASNGDFGGNVLYGFNSTASNCGVYGIDWLYRDLPVNATRVRIEARCVWGTCPRNQTATSLPGVSSVRMRNIRVVVRDDSAPGLSNGQGALWTSNDWLRGVQNVSFDAGDNTGIRQTSVLLDGVVIKSASNACNDVYTVPCPNQGLATSVDTVAHRDGSHTLTLQAVDSAGNAGQASRTLLIDNTAPTAPQSFAVDGGEGWRSANDFTVRWKNPSGVPGAPIAGAEYELCAVPKGACTRAAQDGKSIAALEHLKAPGNGEWQLRAWLRDAAGNQDRQQASAPVVIRLDDSPPELAFQPPDPQDPTLLAVRAADQFSGLQGGEIDLRREGTDSWQTLPTKLQAGKLAARIDDENLLAGRYDLRAHATDLAGNERTVTTTSDGASAQVTLPLRLATRLRVGRVTRSGGRPKLRPRTRIDASYGRAVRLRGRLAGPDGNPLADAEVLVYAQTLRPGAAVRLAATLKTSRRGGFSYRAPKGPSRLVRFRYAGTGTIRAATQDVRFLVHAQTTLRANRRSVVNGETVRFRGRLKGRGIPRAGKLVELQVLLRGRLRTFATTHTDRRGRWYYDYRFDGTRGSQVYRFRARIPRETGYPYEPGRSRLVKVGVRGV